MRFFLILSLSIYLISCQENDLDDATQNQIWTIDTEYLRRGCYDGRDCIPSLETPDRSAVGGSSLSFLSDDDLIVGIWDGFQYVAYPHSILDWHEIINEDGYTISYCPLTGSAIHITTESEFGVSGLLYNSNLIMYDRATNSYWPQMLLRSASGSSSGSQLHLNNLVETSWGNWKSLFPDTKVINSNTGYSRNYARYPYGGYKTCNSLSCGDYIYFPVAVRDSSIPAKARILTIINGDAAKAFRISSFPKPHIARVNLDGEKFVVVISGEDNIAVVFQTVRDLSIDTWDIPNGKIILKDSNSGGSWNILGQNLDDSASAPRLKTGKAFIAYWFSVVAFYPDVELVEK